MDRDRDEVLRLRREFGRRFTALRNGWPQAAWAERYGLSTGAVRDLEQGRVLPSRAVVVLLAAIEICPEVVQRAAQTAADDLAAIERVRTGRN